MRVTQWGEYGVLFSLFLATCRQKGQQTVGASDIATAHSIALDYTQQILQRLRKGGVVESVRGPQGGYRLSREPKDITLRDILISAEGDSFEILCESKPLSPERCAPEASCVLRPIWYALKEHVDSFLNERTLQSLLESTANESSRLNSPVQLPNARLPSLPK